MSETPSTYEQKAAAYERNLAVIKQATRAYWAIKQEWDSSGFAVLFGPLDYRPRKYFWAIREVLQELQGNMIRAREHIVFDLESALGLIARALMSFDEVLQLKTEASVQEIL